MFDKECNTIRFQSVTFQYRFTVFIMKKGSIVRAAK